VEQVPEEQEPEEDAREPERSPVEGDVIPQVDRCRDPAGQPNMERYVVVRRLVNLRVKEEEPRRA
jgi:hypothetical protein